MLGGRSGSVEDHCHLLCSLLLLGACTQKSDITSLAQLSTRACAVPTGTVADKPLQAVEQQAAVGQLGERVVEGELVNRLFIHPQLDLHLLQRQTFLQQLLL